MTGLLPEPSLSTPAAPAAFLAIARVAGSRKLPIIPLRCLAVLLLVSDDQALALADTGRVPWLFNIARRGAVKRELRLPFADALDILLDRKCAVRTFDAVLDSMFPSIARTTGAVRAVTVQAAFSCSQQLISQHLADGELDELDDSDERGPKQSPSISFASIHQFLISRRVGAA